MEYWPKNLLEDLPGGRPPPKLKKTRDIGAKPRSQTNFEKIIQIEYIDPKKSKNGRNIGKKTYWRTYQGGGPPPKLKKTRDIGATPRSQTNFEKTMKIEYIDPKKSKKGGILAKNTYWRTYKG